MDNKKSLGENLLKGLNEALAFEKGEIELKTSERSIADFSVDELKNLAKLPSEEFNEIKEDTKTRFERHEAEVNSFIYTRNITRGDTKIPRELIYLDYVKDRKNPITPYDFFCIMKMKFESKKVMRLGYITVNYYLNWPGVGPITNEIFLTAYKAMRPYRRPHHGKANYKATRKYQEKKRKEASKKEDL